MKTIKFYIAALLLMVCSAANAQVAEPYLNVYQNGTWTSFPVTSDLKVNWGDKKINSTGTAKATIGGNEVNVPWVQLWAGGPKFAKFNVGVTDDKEESYGGYYAWGGSQDRSQDNVDDHNTGTVDLTGDADTANKLWGSAWRMPTQAELQALLDNCDVAWTANYNESGVKGRIFTGKGDYASNSVFLPAAGCCESYVYNRSSYGYYWCSTPDGSDYAGYLRFELGDQGVSNGYRYLGERKYGYSVRAVLAE